MVQKSICREKVALTFAKIFDFLNSSQYVCKIFWNVVNFWTWQPLNIQASTHLTEEYP